MKESRLEKAECIKSQNGSKYIYQNLTKDGYKKSIKVLLVSNNEIFAVSID